MFRLQRVAFLLLLPMGSTAFGGFFVPPGLNPGDRYHLVFVSSTTRDATSSDIGVYNDFIQGVADAAGIGASEGVSWYALASTATTDARDNAPVTAPVYRMDGLLVSSGFADLWDGDISNPINLDEYGTSTTFEAVWTGSYRDGVAANPLGIGNSRQGDPAATDSYWINRGWNPGSGTLAPLYGLSAESTVIPEPSSLIIWVLLGAVVGAIGYAKRRSRAAE